MRCSPRALYGAAVGFAAGISLYESERPLPAAPNGGSRSVEDALEIAERTEV